ILIVDPAVGHLPGVVRIIDPRPDEHLALAVEQHHADAVAVEMIFLGHGPPVIPASSRDLPTFLALEDRQAPDQVRGDEEGGERGIGGLKDPARRNSRVCEGLLAWPPPPISSPKRKPRRIRRSRPLSSASPATAATGCS